MSDYRRAVYYLYNYENGRKRNNVGFTRVEQMNGTCKMMSRIRVPSMNGKTLDVCLFIREGKEISFLPLGKMQIRNMTGEFRITVEENDIMEMGYDLKEMKGMVIYESMQKFFGSEWDDQPIFFQEFKLAREKNRREHKDTFLEYITNKNQNLSTENKERPIIEAKKEADKEKEILQEPPLTAASSVEEIDCGKYAEETEDVISKGEKIEKEEKIYKEEKQEKEDKTIKKGQKEKEDKIIKKETVLRQEKKELNQEAVLEPLQENKIRKSVSDPILPGIFYQFPQMNPFEDEEMTDCVRIEPQDIGRLPMESWILANNSFLLHSYYSYRHLLLARRNSGSGFEYVLCAPGICQNREQFMAAMFGFCDFKPVKNVKDKNGEFGYWYMPVIIEN